MIGKVILFIKKAMKWYKYDIREQSIENYTYWHSLMNEEKKQRINRCRIFDDRKRTVAGEMLARKAIAEWCDTKPENIRFKISKYGKPCVANLDVEFNISHSGNIVVCAIDDKPVGIDIEKIHPVNLTVAKRICTDEELFFLFGYKPTSVDFTYTDNNDILNRFFMLWTAKEAYGKCIGKGLCYDFLNSSLLKHIHAFSMDKYHIAIATI